MSAGKTVFAYTCAQCVVEIKRTKQYFLICVRTSFFRPLLSQAVLHNVVYRSKTKNLDLFYRLIFTRFRQIQTLQTIC